MPTMEIVLTLGPDEGRVVPLDGRRSVTIGRASTNDIVIKDEKVSSHHARLDIAPGGIILTDLGSKNGTYAGGECIVGSRLLTEGTEVALGNSKLSLRTRESSGDTPGNQPSSASSAKRRAMRRPMKKRPKPPEQNRDLVLEPMARSQPVGSATRNLSKAHRNLAVLIAVGELLSSERDPDRFLTRLMDLVFDMLPADRGSILLRDSHDEPQTRVTRGSDREGNETLQVSRTILSKVMDGGVSILTADAGTDARLSSGVSIIAQSIRSAMCVPIQGKRKVLGAIYVDTVLSIGVFGKEDLHVLATIGLLAGTGIENIRLIRKNLETERMAAIGKVIAGLGHDIRNMLTALRGGMYLLDDSLKQHADPDTQQAWSIVRHGHESITGLVQDMVNYSKPREPEWRLSDINQVALTAVTLARESAREKRVQVTDLMDHTIAPFWFDGKAVERCIMNLLSNAIDAAAENTGVVSVATEVHDARNIVKVIVQDNGEGIPSAHRERVFDLLFSTKGSRGTGFGLAITKKLMEEHRGRVCLRSEVGQGTVFTLELPMRTEAATPVR